MAELKSITEHLNAEDIFAEMRMERQAFSGAFLLLEGLTDIKRFDKFFDGPNTSVVTCWGKLKLLELFQLVEASDLKGYLAFIDADFDSLTDNKIESENIIYSEGHDFDIDTIRTSVFNRYMREVSDNKKCAAVGDDAAVMCFIANSIRPLSLLKYSKILGNIDKSISSIDWGNCYECTNFNLEKLVYRLLKKDAPSTELIKRTCDTAFSLDSEKLDIWQITNGHDFFYALGMSLKSQFGKRRKHHIESREIEMHFRLTIDDEDFRSMRVYDSINAWVARENRPILSERFN
ncbi:MAG: DUF4435 domain-containing protein [Robiginitomaculum sp.]|nr:DUF4435 domain-containing protein [Robiginitomaculum sp.]